MGTYILDLMIANARVQYLMRMCKAYRPVVSAQFVIDELSFVNNDIGLDFLKRVGCVLVESNVETPAPGSDVIDRQNSSGNIRRDYIQLDINTKDTVLDPSAVMDKEKLLL